MTLCKGNLLAKVSKKTQQAADDLEDYQLMHGEVSRVFEVVDFEYSRFTMNGKTYIMALLKEVE